MMNYVLAPSILAADFKVLGQEMKKTEENGAAYIHFDVMDGMFVPSISFGMPVLASIHDATEQFMDVHLMVQEPIRYVEAFQKAGADYVTVHLEACEDVKTTLDKIHACGMKAGLAVNPETDVKELQCTDNMQLKSESGDVSIKRADLTDGQISLDDGELQMGNSSFNGDMEITSSNGDVSIQMKKSSVDKTNIYLKTTDGDVDTGDLSRGKSSNEEDFSVYENQVGTSAPTLSVKCSDGDIMLTESAK